MGAPENINASGADERRQGSNSGLRLIDAFGIVQCRLFADFKEPLEIRVGLTIVMRRS
jgi:hypothetical protein